MVVKKIRTGSRDRDGKRRAAAITFLLIAFAASLSGCGYTQKSLLPENIKSIHVMPVKNAIDLSVEISDKDHFRVYRPGVEVELTNAIINRFIFDGNLKVAGPEAADAVVEAKLVDYRRDSLRYSESDDVVEYRLSVVIEVKVYQASDQVVLWEQKHLTGDTTFFISGPHAISEDEAAAKAVEDTARRVVENTIELW
jgi:hypothetical protein